MEIQQLSKCTKLLSTTGCHIIKYDQINILYRHAENQLVKEVENFLFSNGLFRSIYKHKRKASGSQRFNSEETTESHEGVKHRSSIVYERSDGEQDHSVLPR